MDGNDSIVKLNNLQQALASAETIEAKTVLHNELQSITPILRQMLREHRINFDDLYKAAVVKLDSERQIGAMLAEIERNPGGGTKYGSSQGDEPYYTQILEESGIHRQTAQRWQEEAELPDDVYQRYLVDLNERQIEPTSAWLHKESLKYHNKPHVSFNSGESEWYTPSIYIEAARSVMGSIDTDPASSDKANGIVKAERHFTVETDGLQQQWVGNVWMNPPYSQPLVADFCNLLISKYQNHEFKQACVLVNNATETTFYQNMLSFCKAVCFVRGRIKFIDKNGIESGAPLQGQTVLYFGDNVNLFIEYFSSFGVVLNAQAR